MKRSISVIMLVFCLVLMAESSFCQRSIHTGPGGPSLPWSLIDKSSLPGLSTSRGPQVISANEANNILPVDLKEHWIAIGNHYPNAAILHKAVMLDTGKRIGTKVWMRFNNTFPGSSRPGSSKGKACKGAFVPFLEINYFFSDGSSVSLWERPMPSRAGISPTSEWARSMKRRPVPADEIHLWHNVTARGFGTLPVRLQKKKGASGYYSADSVVWLDGVFVSMATPSDPRRPMDVAAAKTAFSHALSMLRVIRR